MRNSIFLGMTSKMYLKTRNACKYIRIGKMRNGKLIIGDTSLMIEMHAISLS